MSASAMDVEQRRFSRVALRRSGTLELFDRSTPCELVDISLRGAKLKLPSGVEVEEGQLCTATLRLDGGPSLIRMRGVIAHCHGDYAAVHCERTDLDSLAHLRRVLELNLGDDKLVQAELATFVGCGDVRPSR